MRTHKMTHHFVHVRYDADTELLLDLESPEQVVRCVQALSIYLPKMEQFEDKSAAIKAYFESVVNVAKAGGIKR